jgi:hypothetical protein
MVKVLTKPQDVTSVEDDAAVEAARETATALSAEDRVLEAEQRKLAVWLNPNRLSTDPPGPTVPERIVAQDRLKEIGQRRRLLVVAMAEADAALAAARERAYQTRRPQAYALVNAARERFYSALRRLAEEEHAALREACVEANGRLGRTEFTAILWPELDAIENYRSVRGGELEL